MLTTRFCKATVCGIFILLLSLTASSDAFVSRSVLKHGTVSFSSAKILQQQQFDVRSTCSTLRLSADPKGESTLPMLLDPGTKGGALFLSLILFILPLIGYQFCTNVLGYDGIDVGRFIGVGFTLLTTVLWVGTYIFRVATKDMTYVSTDIEYQTPTPFFEMKLIT